MQGLLRQSEAVHGGAAGLSSTHGIWALETIEALQEQLRVQTLKLDTFVRERDQRKKIAESRTQSLSPTKDVLASRAPKMQQTHHQQQVHQQQQQLQQLAGNKDPNWQDNSEQNRFDLAAESPSPNGNVASANTPGGALNLL